MRQKTTARLRRIKTDSEGNTVVRASVPSPGPSDAITEGLLDPLNFLDANLDIAVSVNESASLFGVSRATLVRLARRAIGGSFLRHRTRLRLIRAAQWLAGGRKPIVAIAAEIGRSHQSYMGCLSRWPFGSTPRVYRKLHFVAGAQR